MNPSEFEDAYEDKEKLKGAIVTEPISSLNPAAPLSISVKGTVGDAVALMNQKKIGCVCITDGGRLVGIFTERDLLSKVVGGGRDTKTTPVAEVMTRDPETLTPLDKIAFAINKMHVGGFRHVPLVENGKLVGIISIKDIAEFVVSLFPDGVLNVPSDPALGIPTRTDGG